MSNSTEPSKRRILLAVAGLTPQIITETIYALVTNEKVPFIPTEIHLITTIDGADRAKLMLLSDEPGWFHKLRSDYQLPSIDFSEKHIHVVTDSSGTPLGDIRSEEDNRAAADYITDMVRTLTADDSSTLHVSLAGGRKTMGYYVGYALSLYGREQDRLSHVLVSSPFEGNHNFYYPTPYSNIIYGPPPESRPLDTRNAVVTLADIPFVRLRHGLPETLHNGASGFSEAIMQVQKCFTAPSLAINMSITTLTTSVGTVAMSPAEFSFYTFFATRTLNQLPPVRWTDEGLAAAYLEHYSSVVGQHSGDYDRVATALKDGMTKEYFEQRKAKTNAALRRQLGVASRPYLITTYGTRPEQRYALAINPSQVTLDNA